MFAKRTDWDLRPNRISEKLAQLRGRGEKILDLTESNPTRVGLRYPEGLLRELADPRSFLYEPDPKGLLSARQTAARIFSGKGVALNPDRIFLTAGTSEAYGMLLRLLAEPGEQLLTPRPSYPLFDYLAQLNDLETAPYSLRLGPDNRWRVDLDELSKAMTARTRALILVHPNNPTGSCVTQEELARMVALCEERGVALIADEVFAEYLYQRDESLPATLLGGAGVLVFALGGLSKWMGLPQMKLAWIACAGGPERKLSEALARLEVIADTFLSVSTPVQAAFPQWAGSAPLIQEQIRGRIRRNRRWLREAATGVASVLPADGGWNAVLQLPAMDNEEAWTLRLLEKERVRVHPGYFFDFEQPNIAVVSLLPAEEDFREGIGRLFEQID